MSDTNENQNVSVLQAIGANATTFNETLKKADLNWEVESDEVVGKSSGVAFPRRRMLYRSDTKQPLGIVGEGYQATSPKEFLERQFEFAEQVGGKVTRVGFIPERAGVFAFVQLGQEIVLPKKDRKVNDVVQSYIYSKDGWSGNRPCTSALYVERLVCANGAARRELLDGEDLWVSHTRSMNLNYAQRCATFLDRAKGELKRLEAEFAKLIQTRMSLEEAKAFLEKLLPGESTRSEKRREEVLGLFQHGAGNLGRTRWDVYGAVTEYVTHRRTYRETEVTNANTNRFLSVVETDTLAPRALNMLLN